MHCYRCCSLVEFLISDRQHGPCYDCPACGHTMNAIGIEKDEWVVRPEVKEAGKKCDQCGRWEVPPFDTRDSTILCWGHTGDYDEEEV